MQGVNVPDEWIQKTMCYRWLHREASNYYYKLDLIFTYVIVLFGFCNALIVFICNTYYNDHIYIKDIETFVISSSSLAISATAQLHRKAKFFEASEKHNNHSREFEALNRKFRNLWLNNDNNTIVILVQAYDDLANAAPFIPNIVLNKFNSKYGNLNIWKPNALYGLDDLISKKYNQLLKKAFLVWFHSYKNHCNV